MDLIPLLLENKFMIFNNPNNQNKNQIFLILLRLIKT